MGPSGGERIAAAAATPSVISGPVQTTRPAPPAAPVILSPQADGGEGDEVAESAVLHDESLPPSADRARVQQM